MRTHILFWASASKQLCEFDREVSGFENVRVLFWMDNWIRRLEFCVFV